jgi:hypothetical protein
MSIPALVLLGLTASLASAAAPGQQQQQRGKGPVTRRYNPAAPKIADGPLIHINVGGQNYPHGDLAGYKDLRNAAMTLLQKYPPDKHAYVGLGRDGSPFTAFLQEIGTDAFNFPASNVGHTGTALLDKHFEKLIPAHIRNGNKTIVIFDQTSSGKTPINILPLLQSYLQRTGSTVKVKAVAFGAPTVSQSHPDMEAINTSAWPEVAKFYYPPYEGVVSPYERHTPSVTPVEQIQWRPQYDQYRAALGQRIERDPDLDRFLAPFAKPAAPPKPAPKGSRAQAWGIISPHIQGMPPLGAGATLNLTRKKQSYSFLDQQQYDSLAWGTQQLLRRHPPNKGRFYLGVGRSSSAIVAYLENLGLGNVGYLPSDGLKNDQMTPQLEQTFASYFQQFIPRQVLANNETIVLFQQSDTGATMTALKPTVERWVASQGSQSKVEVVAYSTKATSQGVTRIDTRNHQALQELNGDAFKATARYTYHRVGTDAITDLKPRSEFGQFKTALLGRMQEDTGLDKFLNSPE